MTGRHIIYLFLSASIVLGNWNCTSAEEPLFEMQLDAQFTLPPALNNLDTHYFFVRNVPTRYRTYFSGARSTDDISAIYPNRALLDALFVNIDWGIIREISIHAVSMTDPNQSKEIFYHDRVNPNNIKDLELISSLSEVKDILLQEFITLEVRVNLWRTTSTEVQSRITMNFNVNGPE